MWQSQGGVSASCRTANIAGHILATELPITSQREQLEVSTVILITIDIGIPPRIQRDYIAIQVAALIPVTGYRLSDWQRHQRFKSLRGGWVEMVVEFIAFQCCRYFVQLCVSTGNPIVAQATMNDRVQAGHDGRKHQSQDQNFT